MNDFLEKWKSDKKYRTKIKLIAYTAFVVIVSVYAISASNNLPSNTSIFEDDQIENNEDVTNTIDIPTNYTYKIVEKNKERTAELRPNESYDDKFTVIYSSDVTLESNGSTGNLTVTNKFNPQQIVMPETGGTPLIYLLPFGIIAIALSGAAMIIYKKKLQGYSLLFGRKRR